jgi:transcriptional regulator with XRE-family HTH domain
MKDIGKNIKEYRISRNLSQEELAEKLGLSKRTISNYESGRSRPNLDMLKKIAEELEVEINEIVYGASAVEKKGKHKIAVMSVSGVVIAAAVAVLIMGGNFANRLLRDADLWGFVDAYIYLVRPLMMFIIGFFISVIICQLGIIRSVTEKTKRILLAITAVLLLLTVVTLFHGGLYLVNQVWADIQVINAKADGASFVNAFYPISIFCSQMGRALYDFVEKFWLFYLVIGAAEGALLFTIKKKDLKAQG